MFVLLPGKRWLLWTNSVGALLAVDRSVDTVFQYGYLVSSSYSKFDLTKKVNAIFSYDCY